MEKYFKLLVEKRILRHRINTEKRDMHKKLVELNKTTFMLLDILVIIAILFNFGAVVLTNALVVREEPDIEMKEVNPVQSKINNLEQHPESNKLLMMLFKQLILWFIMIFCYIYVRRNVYTEEGLLLLLAVVSAYTILYGYDFFNNFGYWIGKALFK